MTDKPLITGLKLDELQDFLLSKNLPKFAASQIYQWLYKKFEFNVENWSNVSKLVKAEINQHFSLLLPEIVWSGHSIDGTIKLLIKMADGKSIETVAIPAKNDRLTICLSSQVGCAIGCTFCHTGTMGLTRHLSAGEIVAQVICVTKYMMDKKLIETRPSNLVYMGQGEPLHNFENVKQATFIFMEDIGLGFGQRKITLSTSGLVPQIEKLSDFPPINVAISLHAAHDNIRSELMPINKAYDLKRLFGAIKKIPLKAHRWITYEYLLIADLNDRQEDIDGLCQLLDKKMSKINLIPFNEYPQSKFKRPSATKTALFQDKLIAKGFICTTRASKGPDILAACGQLKSEIEDSKLNLWD